jgi:hypothetical protein
MEIPFSMRIIINKGTIVRQFRSLNNGFFFIAFGLFVAGSWGREGALKGKELRGSGIRWGGNGADNKGGLQLLFCPKPIGMGK